MIWKPFASYNVYLNQKVFIMNYSLKNILFLDIETVGNQPQFDMLGEQMQAHWYKKAQFLRDFDELGAEELFEQRAAIYAEFGKVVVISFGFFYEHENGRKLRVKSIYGDDEKQLLSDFSELLSRSYNKGNQLLCAHNGKEFDFPYLCRRMLINEVPIPSILNLSGKKPWEVQHLDTMELWKFGDRKSYTSLDLLASLFDIPSSKGDMEGSQVHEVYYKEKNLERIKKYCEQDVVVTARLLLKFTQQGLLPEDQIEYV